MIFVGLMLVLASVFVSPGGEYSTPGANAYTAINPSAPILNQVGQHEKLPDLFIVNASSSLFFMAEPGIEGENSESEDETQNTGSSCTYHKDLLNHYLRPSAHPSSSRALLFLATARIILYQVFLI